MGSKTSRSVVSTSRMEPLYMSYFYRHCNRRDQNIWPIHPIFPALHNVHQNPYGQIKEDSSWLILVINKLQNQTRAYPVRHTTALDELTKIFKNDTDLLPSEYPLPAQPTSTKLTQPREIRTNPVCTPKEPETTSLELYPIQHPLPYPLTRVKK